MNLTPPRLATSLLHALTLSDHPVVGDLDEAFRGGHSNAWYWGQTFAIIAAAPLSYLTRQPLRALRGLAVGWAVCLAVFEVFELFIAPTLLLAIYGRPIIGSWPVFWIAACVCSYVGFIASAWIVARVQGTEAGPSLLIYIASILAAMLIAVGIVQLHAPQPTRVPHVFFPLVSVGLPYQWRSGLVLAPLTMLVAGMIATRGGRQRAAE